MIRSKVAKRYAKALMSLGHEDGHFQEYGKDLRDFSEFCRDSQEFQGVISSPVFSVEDRRKILDFVLEKSGFTGTVKNFLNLLLDKNRIGAIEVITDYYDRLTDQMSNIARAEIVTPRPIKTEAMSKLERVLGDMTSKTVKIQVREDRSLIGGIIVKIGDLVLDGSIKAQLEGLRESLKKGGYN